MSVCFGFWTLCYMYICHSCYRCCCCRRRICVYVFCVCLRRLVHVMIISKSAVYSEPPSCLREVAVLWSWIYVNDNFSFSTMKIVDKYMTTFPIMKWVCVTVSYICICANLTFKLFNLKTTHPIRHKCMPSALCEYSLKFLSWL